uniref:Uncharacterized protein n=1 Tax=Anguilla anguilla TaxID=7936 RepID=A0A0E9RQU4_ANGAN
MHKNRYFNQFYPQNKSKGCIHIHVHANKHRHADHPETLINRNKSQSRKAVTVLIRKLIFCSNCSNANALVSFWGWGNVLDLRELFDYCTVWGISLQALAFFLACASLGGSSWPRGEGGWE